MPLYAYRCTQCGNRYEKIQSFSSEVETVCPKCGGAVERPLTAPGLKFKGAGWYINDYAPKSSGSSDSTDKPASDTAKSTDSKPSDAKPAATESKSTTSESSAKPSSTTSTS